MSAFTYEVSHLSGIIVWLSYILYVVVPLILTPLLKHKYANIIIIIIIIII